MTIYDLTSLTFAPWLYFWPVVSSYFNSAVASSGNVAAGVFQSCVHFVFEWVLWLFDPHVMVALASWLFARFIVFLESILPTGFQSALHDVWTVFNGIDWLSGLKSIRFLASLVVTWPLVIICLSATLLVYIVSILVHWVIWILSMVWSSPE